MNKWLYFLSGLILGAAGGAVGHHIYMVKKLDKYTDEEIEEYEDISEEYLRSGEDEVNPDKTNTGREHGPITAKQRDEIRSKLKKNWEKTTNYASMYSGANEHPVDSDEDEEIDISEESNDSEEIEAIEEALDATMNHEANKNKKPRIISYEAVTDLPSYIEQEDLFYYMDDDILANEAEEELDPETFVGDALRKYGFAYNDETEIYVMNYQLDTCYCITKVNSAFADVKTT